MARTCNCCGCVLTDGGTSVVSGTGQVSSPYEVEVLDPLFSEQRYAFRRQRSTNQSIANDTLTEVDFTTALPESFDRGGFFTAPSTFTIPSTGIYAFGATVAFADNATGTRYIEIVKNDLFVVTAMESKSIAGAVHFVTATGSDKFSSTDTLKLRVRQTSGGALNIAVSGEQSPVLWAIYIGRFV
jgi:hypothetical protein